MVFERKCVPKCHPGMVVENHETLGAHFVRRARRDGQHAAAGAAAAAIGMWYSQRRQPTVSEFTEPPTNWGEAMLRLHEVVRISWKEALSKLGVWRLDHLLAIRHLSNRDMSAEIAADAARCGTLVEVRPRPRANPRGPFGTTTIIIKCPLAQISPGPAPGR